MLRPPKLASIVAAVRKTSTRAACRSDIFTKLNLVTPCAGCMRRQSVTSWHPKSKTSSARSTAQLMANGYLYVSSAETAICRPMSSGTAGNKDSDIAGAEPQSEIQQTMKDTTKPLDTVVKVTVKTKPRVKIDFSASYTANIFITPVRAMDEYLLNSSDLDDLKRTKRRSPYPEKEDITVFLRRDVEQKATEKFGSFENLERERQKIKARERRRKALHRHLFRLRHYPYRHIKKLIMNNETIFRHGPGRVVLYAIVVNGTNAVVKLFAWLYTGSHSMFSEFVHSVADMVNQCILAIGIHQSLKGADLEHPYGWSNFRNVASLISGVGIFCLGAGMSIYHGIIGLAHPEQAESLVWAIAILGGSFISEGATLMAAFHQTYSTAQKEKMTFLEYVWRGKDPSTNVVLVEDAAAMVGVTIAAACMAISHYSGSPIPDAVGSLLIGTLLGSVASFIIYTNTVSLVGRSIPEEHRQDMMKILESDRLIRALHDVKATDMGSSYVRFKAEVDFDGQEVARFYLEKQDLELMMKEMNKIETLEEVEAFMLKHGENVVDTLGSEVDRIEKNLKRKHPEIRHVDLEQL